MVCGFSRGKDLLKCINIAKQISLLNRGETKTNNNNKDEETLHFIQADHARAIPSSVLEYFLDYSSSSSSTSEHLLLNMSEEHLNSLIHQPTPPLPDTLTQIFRKTLEANNNNSNNRKEVILICGSVFIMSEVRKWLGIEEARDLDVNVPLGTHLKSFKDYVLTLQEIEKDEENSGNNSNEIVT